MIGNILVCIMATLSLIAFVVIGIGFLISGIREFRTSYSKVDGILPFCGGIFTLLGVITIIIVALGC